MRNGIIATILLAGALCGRAEGGAPNFAHIEARHGGRLGVAVRIPGKGMVLSHRGAERFAMCSTFKFLLAAAVAAQVDAGRESWDRAITYGESDILPWAPVTGKPDHLNAGWLPVSALCEAAMTWSDNPAANLLYPTVGGPEGLTAWLRSLGDSTTRMDRTEPDLNTNLPGDPRDTTTPEAVAATMERLLLGDVLSHASRNHLLDWLVQNHTGDKRIRAGLDPAWRVGDKTGTGDNGAANDLAIFWPKDHPPVLLAVFYESTKATPDQRDAAIAETAAMVRRFLETGR